MVETSFLFKYLIITERSWCNPPPRENLKLKSFNQKVGENTVNFFSLGSDEFSLQEKYTKSGFLFPLSLQTNAVDLGYFMNSLRSNNLSLKYQRFTPSGCKDIQIKIFELVNSFIKF